FCFDNGTNELSQLFGQAGDASAIPKRYGRNSTRDWTRAGEEDASGRAESTSDSEQSAAVIPGTEASEEAEEDSDSGSVAGDRDPGRKDGYDILSIERATDQRGAGDVSAAGNGLPQDAFCTRRTR